MRLAASALPTSDAGAKARLSGSGSQPDGDLPRRAQYGSSSLGDGSRNCALVNPAIDLGRSPQRHFLKGFNILNPVAHLVTELEEQRPSRFSPPSLQSRLANSPALGQFGLGHASFGLHGGPSAGFVRTAMKALFADEAKPSGQIHKWRIAL